MSTFSSFLDNLNNDSMTGSAGRDLLQGLEGNDILVGLAGSDTLDGGAGSDSMLGGAGNDFYHVDDAGDVVVEGENQGRDTVVTRISYTLGAHVENLRVSNSVLTGLELTGNSLNNGLGGGVGNDTLKGEDGNDQLYGYGGDDKLNGGEGNDTLDGGVGHDTLTGGNGNDYLRGGSGNDVLDGSAGADTLDGGSGADTLKGGLGDHVYYLDNSGDVIDNDAETADAGNDSIVLSHAHEWDVMANVVDGNGNVLLYRKLYDMTVRATHIEHLSVLGVEVGNYHIIGNALDNAISGGYHHDALYGGVGNDTLNGADGEDVLFGEDGNDRLDGGTGNDALYGDQGSDVLDGGDGNDYLDGGAGDDVIFGGHGDDYISDHQGSNTMVGGFGNDSFVIWDTASVITELEGEGHADTALVAKAGRYDADHQHIERVEVSLGLGENVHLVAQNWVYHVQGGGQHDLIEIAGGGDGWHRILGLGGNDTIHGGAGSEHISGDFYWVQQNYDAIYYFNPNGNDDLVHAGDGHDTLIGGWGNDSLIGGNGDDVFEFDNAHGYGYANEIGNDTLEGELGSDHYHFGNVEYRQVVEGVSVLLGDGGHDLVRDIGHADDQDVLTIGAHGAAISQADVSFEQNGNDLRVRLNGSSTQSMTWQNFFNGHLVLNSREHRAELIQFADGFNQNVSTTWDLNTVTGTTAFLAKVTVVGQSAARVQASPVLSAASAKSGVQMLSSVVPLIGTQGNDSLVGGANSDSISGLAGNDTLIGNDGNDTLIGNEGNDSLLGNAGNDTLLGGAGNDAMNGGAGADRMEGGLGNDTYVVDNVGDLVLENLNEGIDTVVLSGLLSYTLTANVERLNVGSSALAFTLLGNALSNSIAGGNGSDSISGGAGNDTLVGGAGADVILGGDGNDSLLGDAGNDTLSGGDGMDTLKGGSGNDVYLVFDVADLVEETLNAGTDWVHSALGEYALTDHVENALIHPDLRGAGLIGNTLNNSLVGSQGDDTLIGGAGADTLNGGLGNDQYEVDHVGDVIIELEHAGFDSVVINTTGEYQLGDHVESASAAAGVAFVHIKAGNLGSTLTGTVNSGDTLVGGAGGDWITGGAGSDSITGHAGSDTLFGDHRDFGDGSGTDTHDSHDTLKGGDGDDVLIGGLGSDLMEGGTGSDAFEYYYDDGIWKFQLDAFGMDTMRGGEGNDVYVVDNAFDIIEELANEGEDWVRSFLLSYALADHVEIAAIGFYEGFPEGAKLIGNDLSNTLYGNVGGDTLVGGAGNDTLIGGEGGDEMEGGLGDDVYYVDSFLDFVNEWDNEGIDKVIASVDYVLDDNVEDVEYATAPNVIPGGVTFIGNALNNRITGSDFDDVLNGGGGNDTLVGGAGANLLVGGLGDDLMLGGSGTDYFEHRSHDNTPDSFALDQTQDTMVGAMGDDVYVVDHINDVVTENAGEGDSDLVRSFVSAYTLAANVEMGAIASYAISAGASLTGNDLDNMLWGNLGSDTLSGGLGNDVVYARDGNDQLMGGEGNDALYAEEGNDTLSGGDGSDLLDGGAGNDSMLGGLGDDTYHVNNSGDRVTESANEGIDTVVLSTLLSYTLTANLENLNVGLGTSNFTLTGNVLNNIIVGGAGHDTIRGDAGNDTLLGGTGNDSLNGGAGADRMEGGIGNDTYNVDNAGDVVVENANEGTDSVVLSTLLTYTMAVNIENLSVSTSASALTLVGNASNNSISGSNGNDTIRGEAGNDTLNGGAGNDSLVGGSGNDVLSGGTGADRMEGGTENDTYHVDNAADVVLENANAGTDTVVLSTLLTYTLAANVENLNVGTSASAFTLTGNVLNNTIAGGSGHDTIAGEAGNDSLLGGLGNDKLNGGAGDDRLSGGAGSDTLTGGAGADRFTFDVAFASTNLDTIEDFTKSQGDKIAVEDTVFTKLAGKTNLSTHFRLSTDAAVGGDDFLVYNTATGQLFYDATGSSNNTSTMQLFAILSTKPLDLTGTDFVVI